jgi:hypothetical protein
MTEPEYDAVHDSISTLIEKSYALSPGIAKDMADAATAVLRAHDRHALILAIGQEIADEDDELLQLLAQ